LKKIKFKKCSYFEICLDLKFMFKIGILLIYFEICSDLEIWLDLKYLFRFEIWSDLKFIHILKFWVIVLILKFVHIYNLFGFEFVQIKKCTKK
jgi:hypothetical protein